MKIALISDVYPDVGRSGGHIVMHRHLVEHGAGDYEHFTFDDIVEFRQRLLGRVIDRAFRSRLYPLLIGAFPLVWRLFYRLRDDLFQAGASKPDLVLTVAHGKDYLTALEAAKRWNVPLVAMFHDWYPDAVVVDPISRPIWDRSFRRLYTQAALAFCVSKPMREYLGPHPNAIVLPPISARCSSIKAKETYPSAGPYRLFYSGFCGGWWRNLLIQLIDAVATHEQFVLDVCGPGAQDISNPCPEKITIHGSVSEQVRQSLVEAADATIVLLSFDSSLRRNLRIHFPSKMIEYCAFNRPTFIWGPSDASATKWAQETGAAIPVTADNADSFLRAVVDSFQTGTAEQSAACAIALRGTQFNPDAVHGLFVRSLRACAVGRTLSDDSDCCSRKINSVCKAYE